MDQLHIETAEVIIVKHVSLEETTQKIVQIAPVVWLMLCENWTFLSTQDHSIWA